MFYTISNWDKTNVSNVHRFQVGRRGSETQLEVGVDFNILYDV